MKAIKKMGKNKATSIDGVSDIIFQEKEIKDYAYRRLEHHFLRYGDNI